MARNTAKAPTATEAQVEAAAARLAEETIALHGTTAEATDAPANAKAVKLVHLATGQVGVYVARKVVTTFAKPGEALDKWLATHFAGGAWHIRHKLPKRKLQAATSIVVKGDAGTAPAGALPTA